MTEYLEKLSACLKRIEEEEKDSIRAAAEKAAEVIRNDGLIYVFGCGQSHLPGLDAFYRAGGLANVSPMLDTDLMLHNGAAKSSRMEKMPGIGREIYRQAGLETKVLPVTTAEYGLNVAARPFNSRLDNKKLTEKGFAPLPDWRDALARYLEEIGDGTDQG